VRADPKPFDCAPEIDAIQHSLQDQAVPSFFRYTNFSQVSAMTFCERDEFQETSLISKRLLADFPEEFIRAEKI
jgi:hypothetical protein